MGQVAKIKLNPQDILQVSSPNTSPPFFHNPNFIPPLSAILLGQEDRLHSLVDEMSAPLTSLINTLELQQHPGRRLLPDDVLQQLQDASRQIHSRLKDLESLLRKHPSPAGLHRESKASGGGILLVDDRQDGESLWEYVRIELGPDYFMERVETFAQAVEKLSSRPYELLISGYEIRGGSGLKILKKLHDMGIWIPSLMIARRGSERIAAACLEAGFMGYLNDEMLSEPGRLRETVRRVLREGKKRLQWQASLRKVQTLAMMDGLTSLYNRFFIEYLLEMEMRRSRRYGHPFCVALIDLDHFKEINDGHGHSEGDAVLKELATLLKKHHRSTDHIGRFGGDEFLLILPQTTRINGLRLCRRLVGMVSRHTFQEGSANHRLTLSIGLSHWDGGQDPEISLLLQAADEALYRAKEKGRNRVCSTTDSISHAS